MEVGDRRLPILGDALVFGGGRDITTVLRGVVHDGVAAGFTHRQQADIAFAFGSQFTTLRRVHNDGLAVQRKVAAVLLQELLSEASGCHLRPGEPLQLEAGALLNEQMDVLGRQFLLVAAGRRQPLAQQQEQLVGVLAEWTAVGRHHDAVRDAHLAR